MPRFVQIGFAKWVGNFQSSGEPHFTQTYDFILGRFHVAQLPYCVAEDLSAS